MHETIHAKGLSLVKEKDNGCFSVKDYRKPLKATVPSYTLSVFLSVIIIYLYRKNKILAKENKELANQLLKNEHLNIDKKEEAPIEVSEKQEKVEKIFHSINQESEDKHNTPPTIINKEVPAFDHETMEMIEIGHE